MHAGLTVGVVRGLTNKLDPHRPIFDKPPFDCDASLLSENIMQFLKRIIKRTPLYYPLKVIRQKLQPRYKLEEPKPEMVAFYAQFVAPGSLCFDIGANIGNRSIVFLKLGAKVVALEPQTQCAKLLREGFGERPDLTIVQAAAGASVGSAEMWISDASVISSLSSNWIARVRQSGRFADRIWAKKEKVEITTLDILIERFGTPDFIKIDVEGYEYQVLAGLTKPVRALSFEFTPEVIEEAFKCIRHLGQLGVIELNYALGEKYELVNGQRWVSPAEMETILNGFRNDKKLFGDVYVRFLPTAGKNEVGP